MASSQPDVDWQSRKNTVLERNCHMFNNPFLSDVVFTCEGTVKKFYAHKYVLATSSVVFYTMFYGELAETNSVVHLTDTDEESLEEFLRFLYTDECKLRADNAILVLYLAKKYMIPSLAQKCSERLEAIIAAENVFIVLQQAIQFDEENLVKTCWQLVDSQTSDAVASDAFEDVTKAILLQLLQRETLNIAEYELFRAVLKWSEAECSRKGKEANAKNKRDALGNAIYEIRFGSMTQQEFAECTSESGLLTPEEMVLFYQKLNGIERTSEIWNMLRRGAHENGTLHRCTRFQKCSEPEFSIWGYTGEKIDAIGVSFSKPVIIHGVRVFGIDSRAYNVKLQVHSQIVHRIYNAQEDSLGVPGFDVMLPKPVIVQAKITTPLKATITGPTSWYGCEGKETVETNNVAVTFRHLPVNPSNYTNVARGQFHEIIFEII